MLTRVLLIVILAGAGTFQLGSRAEAVSCRSLQLQLVMFQASREMEQYRRVLRRMASQGCSGGQGFSRLREAPAVLSRPAPTRAPQAVPRKRSRTASAPKTSAPRIEGPTARAPRREERQGTRAEPRVSVARGTFRTLCVRACDGYYFPISFSTTREHFARDQASCEQACPGAESLIYYHRVPGEGPESMISLSGEAYTDLPAAFSHRTALNPSCSCGRPISPDETLLTAQSARTTDPTDLAARLPRPRVPRGEDPETLANRDGAFVPRFVARPLLADNESKVRGGVRMVAPDDSNPVPVSPVPNDLDTSLLWDSSPS